MATFDGVSFNERGRGGGTFMPIHGKRVNFSVLKVPGGSKAFLQLGAVPPIDFDLPIQCTAAQLSSLRGKVNTQGSLVYSWGTFTAVLAEIADVREVKIDQVYFQAVLKLQVY